MTYVGKLAVGSVLYAGMPTVMNRVFRHSRAEKAGLVSDPKTSPVQPSPLGSPQPQLPLKRYPTPSVGFYQSSVMAGI